MRLSEMLRLEILDEEGCLEHGVQNPIEKMTEILKDFVVMLFRGSIEPFYSPTIDDNYPKFLQMLMKRDYYGLTTLTLKDLFPRAALLANMEKVRFGKIISIFFDHIFNCNECKEWIKHHLKEEVTLIAGITATSGKTSKEAQERIKTFFTHPNFALPHHPVAESDQFRQECLAMMSILILYYHNRPNTKNNTRSFIEKLNLLKNTTYEEYQFDFESEPFNSDSSSPFTEFFERLGNDFE